MYEDKIFNLKQIFKKGNRKIIFLKYMAFQKNIYILYKKKTKLQFYQMTEFKSKEYKCSSQDGKLEECLINGFFKQEH